MNNIGNMTMHEIEDLAKLTSFTYGLRAKAQSYGLVFEQNYPDLNAFAAISNGLTLTAELLDYYYSKWTDEGLKKITGEYERRIVTICKWTFIHSFSIIEYISKMLILRKNHKAFKEIIKNIKSGKKRVYFSTIINRSAKKSLLSKENKTIWDGLREIRNALVHNNAYMDIDLEFNVDVYQFKFKKGEGITGGIALTLKFTEFLLAYYNDWVTTIIALE